MSKFIKLLDNLSTYTILLEYEYNQSGGTHILQLNGSISEYNFLYICATESGSYEMINGIYFPASLFKLRNAVRICMDSMIDIVSSSRSLDYILYYNSDTSIKLLYYTNTNPDANNRLLIYGIR